MTTGLDVRWIRLSTTTTCKTKTTRCNFLTLMQICNNNKQLKWWKSQTQTNPKKTKSTAAFSFSTFCALKHKEYKLFMQLIRQISLDWRLQKTFPSRTYSTIPQLNCCKDFKDIQGQSSILSIIDECHRCWLSMYEWLPFWLILSKSLCKSNIKVRVRGAQPCMVWPSQSLLILRCEAAVLAWSTQNF